MARVLIPQNPRRYDENATGATTTIVTMKANNPFETSRSFLAGPAVQSRGRVMLAGLGEDGWQAETETSAMSPGADGAPAAESGFNWGNMFSTGLDAVTKLGVPLITGLMAKPQQQAGQPAPIILNNPGVQIPQYRASTPTPASKLPWIIGGVAAAGLVLLLVLRKK